MLVFLCMLFHLCMLALLFMLVLLCMLIPPKGAGPMAITLWQNRYVNDDPTTQQRMLSPHSAAVDILPCAEASDSKCVRCWCDTRHQAHHCRDAEPAAHFMSELLHL